MKLELGAGTCPREGYLHQDIRSLEGIDVVCDARELPQDFKGKLTEIYGSHILEHFGWRKVEGVVKHWAEWLAPGGKLEMISPDFQMFGEWLYLHPHDDYIFERTQYMMQGGQDYPENTHLCCTTAYSMRKWYTAAGLERLDVRRLHSGGKPGEHCPMVRAIGYKPMEG